ncbi:MAG: hypothetical protein ACRDQZ_14710 [Mycobacteriales bacterium]
MVLEHDAQTAYTAAANANQLSGEIATVRRRGITRIDSLDTRHNPMNVPILTELSARYAPGVGLVQAVTALLTAAIETLPDGLNRATAQLLFGIEQEDFHTPHPGQWRKEACALNAMSDENFRKTIERSLLAHLAWAVFAATGDKSKEGTFRHLHTHPDDAGYRSRYIWRTEHEATFIRLLEQGHDVVLLLGQPGTGKSRLADDLVYRHASSPEDVVWLRRVTENTYLRDPRAACAQRGITTEHGDEHKALLAALVQSEHAPEFVVIDTVTWADDLDKMLPTSSRSTIVAVSWAKTTLIKRCGIIRVGSFTKDQTRQLLRLHCPSLSDSDRDLLQQCLHGHPAVITSICDLINSRALTPQAVHDALSTGAPEFLSRINVSRKRTLGDSLSFLVHELETHHPLAAELLGALVYLPSLDRRPCAIDLLQAYIGAAGLTISTAETPLLRAHAPQHPARIPTSHNRPTASRNLPSPTHPRRPAFGLRAAANPNHGTPLRHESAPRKPRNPPRPRNYY